MLSRRSIRVKVMQVLFMLSKDKDLTRREALQFYDDSVNQTYHLYLFNLYGLIRVCACSVSDVGNRGVKHLPSEEDKAFSDKLYTNSALQSLASNEKLEKLFEKHEFESKMDSDMIKRLYKNLSSEEVYKKYIIAEDSAESHIEILHEVYRHLRKDELFNDIMEDYYSAWLDDKSLVIGAIKKTIKALPLKGKFYEVNVPDEETVNEFGRVLLEKVYGDDEYLKTLIVPVLENWDIDRVALVDMIFIKMAICEFLNCVTIPTKVTLNEYVELSKGYSTERSKDFINGILDKLMKIMDEEGLIKKEGRGLLA